MSERVSQKQLNIQRLEQTVLALHSPSKPVYEIAREVGCHTSTVKSILEKNELPILTRIPKEAYKPTQEEGEKFLKLYFGTPEMKGISLNSASVLAGLTPTIAKRFMKDNNIEPKGRGGHPRKKDNV